MREQKYRSWNKEHDSFFYFLNGKYYNSEDLNKCISERICFEFDWSNAEQYTGLKDRIGKEIYFNSDQVRGTDSHGIVYVGTIDNSDPYCIMLKMIVDGGFDFIPLFTFAYSEPFEIIGNIHESENKC